MAPADSRYFLNCSFALSGIIKTTINLFVNEKKHQSCNVSRPLESMYTLICGSVHTCTAVKPS
jgi:hypothetical protein